MDSATTLPTRTALWLGKIVDYHPGTLRLMVKRGYNRKAFEMIAKVGGKVGWVCKGVIDVVVEPKYTLQIASELSRSNLFDRVELCLIKEDSN